MIGSIRNTINLTCPKCGAKLIVKELNDGSPMRTYDSALCPVCGEKVHEDYIVGEFIVEIDEKH